MDADEWGHESLGTVQFVLEFAEAEVRGAENSQEGEACVITFHPAGVSGGWVPVKRVVAGIYRIWWLQFEASIIQFSPTTFPSPRKKAVALVSPDCTSSGKNPGRTEIFSIGLRSVGHFCYFDGIRTDIWDNSLKYFWHWRTSSNPDGEHLE